jgi:hypothetical protein
MRIGLCAVAILSALSTAAFAQAPVKKPACDRTCLEGYMDRYLQAMLDRNVTNDLFARNVRFTENGIQLPLGNEGLWWGMSGLGGYRFYVPDVETQQVALIGTVKENMSNNGVNNNEGNNVAVAIRLKIVEGKITEIEQLAIRPAVQLGGGGARGGAGAGGGRGGAPAANNNPTTGDRVLAMQKPHAIFFEVIPENKRASREDLVIAANHYFTALARHDSKGYYPFTKDCVRNENGIVATNDCLAQFTGNSLNGIVSRIRDRRFVAVDRERGIVFSFAFFDHHRINWTWQLAELFKIEDGLIRRIEAVFHQAPFGIPSGWSTYEQSISEEIQSIR